MKSPAFLLGILCTYLLALASCSKRTVEADILIQNGKVFNGFENQESNHAIAIRGDKIVFVGNQNEVNIKALKTIDATGLIVSPGFIDPHTHADRDLNKPNTAHNLPFMMQGITTVVAGNDGDSFFPVKDYVDKYEEHGIGTNAIILIGHENHAQGSHRVKR